MSKLRLKSEGDSSSSLLQTVYSTYKKEMAALGATHKKIATDLSALLTPLHQFLDENKKTFSAKKDAIEAAWKALEKQKSDLPTLQATYIAKCQAADAAEKENETLVSVAALDKAPSDSVPVMDVMMTIGPMEMTVEELNNTLYKLQRQVPVEDLKTFLGVQKDVFSGQDVQGHVMQLLALSEDGAVKFLNDLIAQSFIQPLSLSSKFQTGSSYKWKKLYLDSEPSFKKARREADIADLEYKKTVGQCEKARVALERSSVEFMAQIEDCMRSRVALIKLCVSKSLALETSQFTAKKEMVGRVQVFLESLNPEKELQVVMEQDRTGAMRLKPFVYRNVYQGTLDTMFGISLDDLSSKSKRKVPQVLTKCLDYCSYYFSTQIGVGSQIDAWTERNMDFAAVREVAGSITTGRIFTKTLETQPIAVVIGLVKLFLFELPVSVCSHDIYEPLKLLYLSKSEDQGVLRLNSLRSLLATMITSHFQTLVTLANHWHKVAKAADMNENQLNELAAVIGPLILRPEVETKLTLHDKHPIRLAKDIIVHFDDLFSLDLPSPADSVDDIRASALSLNEGSWSEGLDGEDLAKLKEHSVFDGSRRQEPRTEDVSEENLVGTGLSEEELLAEEVDDEIERSPVDEPDG